MMAAAHRVAPTAPPPLGGTQPFVASCTGRPPHTRAEALAIVTRRRKGHIFYCRHCWAWHTGAGPRAPGWMP